jgi:hypothetical protein
MTEIIPQKGQKSSLPYDMGDLITFPGFCMMTPEGNQTGRLETPASIIIEKE